MTHICVGKLTIIGSDNCLSPGRHQAITWTNAEILLVGPLDQTSVKKNNRNSYSFIEENTFENVVGEILPISSRSQRVKESVQSDGHNFTSNYHSAAGRSLLGLSDKLHGNAWWQTVTLFPEQMHITWHEHQTWPMVLMLTGKPDSILDYNEHFACCNVLKPGQCIFVS